MIARNLRSFIAWNRWVIGLILCASFVIPSAVPLQAANGINRTIAYQGRLLDAGSASVANGNYDLLFSIYNSSTGGTPLYTAKGTVSSPSTVSVSVSSGLFSILIGDTSAGMNALNIDFNQDALYLGITVSGDSEMTPRKRLSAVPYAFNSETLQGNYASSTVTSTGGALFTLHETTADAASSQRTALKIQTDGTSNLNDYLLVGNDGSSDVFTVSRQGNVTSTNLFATNASTSNINWNTAQGSGLTVQKENITGSSTFGNFGGFPAVTKISSANNSVWQQVWENRETTPYSQWGAYGSLGAMAFAEVSSSDSYLVFNPSFAAPSVGFPAGVLVGKNLGPLTNNNIDLGFIGTAFKNIYASGTLFIPTVSSTNLVWTNATGTRSLYMSGPVTIATGTADGSLTRVLDLGTGGSGNGVGGNHPYFQLESNSSTYPWRWNAYNVPFLSTQDNTLNWGWNAQSSGGRAVTSGPEPAWYWQLESDYEAATGTHYAEAHLNYYSGHSNVTSRPFGAICNRGTDVCTWSQAGGGSWTNTSGTDQLLTFTDSADMGPIQLTNTSNNKYILFGRNNIAPIQQFNAGGTAWFGLFKLNAGDSLEVSPSLRPIQVDATVFPSGNNTISLGEATSSWSNVYASGTAFLGTIDGTSETIQRLNVTGSSTFGNFGGFPTVTRISSANGSVWQQIWEGRNTTPFSVWGQYIGSDGRFILTEASSTDSYLFFNSSSTAANNAFPVGVLAGMNFGPAGTNMFNLGRNGRAWLNVYASGTAFLANVTSTNVTSTYYATGDAGGWTTNVSPITNNALDLGGATNSWRNVYASGTGYFQGTAQGSSIYVGEGGASSPSIAAATNTNTGINIRPTANQVQIITSGASRFKCDSGDCQFTNQLRSNEILPNVDATYSLGSSSFSWANIYASGTIANTITAQDVTATRAVYLTGLVENGGVLGNVCVDVDGRIFKDTGTSCLVSDPKYKDRVAPLSGDALKTVLSLQPIEWDWKPGLARTGHDIGFNAKQAQSVDPRLVTVAPDGDAGFRYLEYTSVLTKAIQEQQNEIDALKADIAVLKAQKGTAVNQAEPSGSLMVWVKNLLQAFAH